MTSGGDSVVRGAAAVTSRVTAVTRRGTAVARGLPAVTSGAPRVARIARRLGRCAPRVAAPGHTVSKGRAAVAGRRATRALAVIAVVVMGTAVTEGESARTVGRLAHVRRRASWAAEPGRPLLR